MKAAFYFVAALIVAIVIAGLTSCVETTVVDPITGASITTKAPAPGVLPFAGEMIRAYSPRPIRVREEKSGPITAEEIKERFKDLPQD